tara:strand:- start:891 stop:1343 length:453 start_codon:yes stop_codon:yes gene_type:complete
MNIDLIYLFIGEIFLILFLYRFLLRQWIVNHWDEKLQEEGWLIFRLEPVIDEIEDRMHEKLEQFQSSFFGSVGKMTAKAKNLDPMNNIRKAAKDGDWTSMLVEYAANKSGLGGVLGQINPQTTPKEGVNNPKSGGNQPLKPSKMKDLLHK